MTAKQTAELLALLDRIAKALETRNYLDAFRAAPVAPQPAPGTIPIPLVQGYTCNSCGAWVPSGDYHSCSGRRPFTYTGSAGSYTQCGAFGTTGGRCYLPKDHSRSHVFVTVTNNVLHPDFRAAN